MKIVTTQALCKEGLELLDEKYEVFNADNGNPETYLDEIKDADALVVRIATCSAKVIDSLPNLKVIGRTGIGYDSVDVKKATEKGIPVVVTPGANNRSVAEHAVSAMLALSKDLVECDNEFRKGNWNVRANKKMFEFENKVVGIIGLGNIGKLVCQMCLGLGMKVLGYDSFFSKEQIEAMGAEYCNEKDYLIREADFITVHVPLFESTRNTIAKHEFDIMKKTAILVNTSRGGIVNEADLIDSLKKGKIAGASLDVYCTEPPKSDDPLFTAPNLLLTPHSAAQTREAVIKMHQMCVEGIKAILNGEKWPYVADKSVYEHPIWKDR